MTQHAAHRPPTACPVCGDRLATTRLGCPGCGTELVGAFESCEFCALDVDDRDVLRVFLASRGNVKDLERHLGVSYPTARARLDRVLERLGVHAADEAEDRLSILRSLASGAIDLAEAERRL